MKKLFFVALAAVAMTFTACKNETKPAEDQTPQENTEAVAEVNYTDSLNAALEAKDASKIEQFVNEIKEKVSGEDVAKYAQKFEEVKKWLADNAETVKSVLGDKAQGLVDAVNGIDVSKFLGDAAANVENAAENAVEGAAEGATSAVEEAKAAGEQVVEDAKAAADKAVEEVKNAPENLKEAGKDALKGAVDKL